MGDPVKLHGGADMRAEALINALEEVIYDRGKGMPLPTIIGVIRLLEHKILEDQ